MLRIYILNTRIRVGYQNLKCGEYNAHDSQKRYLFEYMKKSILQ